MNNIKKHKSILFKYIIENPSWLDFSDELFINLASRTELNEAEIVLLFPSGLKQFVLELEQYCDHIAIKQNNHIRIRDKIKQGVLDAICIGDENHKSFLYKLYKFYQKPTNYELFLKTTWNSADSIWNSIGDRSVDFNYYTKRIILSAVYKSTLCYYLQDTSESYKNTLGFLDKALEKVMAIERIKKNPNVFSHLRQKIPFVRLIKI
jgi:ubiquinone biosynthesis protein COQ9